MGVEVDKISRDWSRREEVVPVATSEQGERGGCDTMLADVRKGKLRCRLQNVCSPRSECRFMSHKYLHDNLC